MDDNLPQTPKSTVALQWLVILETIVIIGLLAAVYYQHSVIKDITSQAFQTEEVVQPQPQEGRDATEAGLQARLNTIAEEQADQAGLDAEALETKLKSLNEGQ